MTDEEKQPNETPADETPDSAETAPEPTPPAGPDEATVREQLGIGSSAPTGLPPEEVENLLRGALEGYEDVIAAAQVPDEGEAAIPSPQVGTDIPSLGADLVDQNLELLRDVHLQVKVELGRGRMYLKDILRLGQGSVVELERLAGDPLDIYVNDKVIARGEVLVLNENFCIRITEVFNPEELPQAL